MFSSPQVKANVHRFPAKIALKGGTKEELYLLVPTHKTLRDLIYENAVFIEVESLQGSRSYLAKSEIIRLEVIEKAEPTKKVEVSDFTKEKADVSRFDSANPFTVLGLEKDAPEDKVKHAYRELAKVYHSDRWVTNPLPLEMGKLAAWIFQRVTEAYHQIVELNKNIQK
jgi:hypothetical protein